jgi:uncharacterized protein (TIGR02271 family)
MEEIIVAVFDTAAHAQAAVQDLRSAHVPEAAIATHTAATAQNRDSGFWSNLFGGEPGHDTAFYDRTLVAGSTVVTIRTPEDMITGVLEILDRHHPIDIDERASSYGLATTGAAHTAPPDAEQTLQLSEEQLQVGKRLVNRGTTRIRRFTTERPVEEQVTLHDEKIVVERRPVTDHRVGEGSFTDRVVEMTETGEEAVIGKTTRVVEEVVVGKQATDRVETVRDTLRREDVEIEQVAGTTARPDAKI